MRPLKNVFYLSLLFALFHHEPLGQNSEQDRLFGFFATPQLNKINNLASVIKLMSLCSGTWLVVQFLSEMDEANPKLLRGEVN